MSDTRQSEEKRGGLYTLVEKTPDPFAKFKAEEFESWLLDGLRRYLFKKKGAWSFPHAEAEFVKEDGPANALKQLHSRLEPEQQSALRMAVAKVAASLPATEEDAVVFEHLLAIAAAMPAPEILRVLPGRVGNGYFGLPDGPSGKKLLSKSLLAVARLAAPRQEAVDCLKDLITSQHFNESAFAYSGIALVALCRADRTSLQGHMELIREPLKMMFDTYKPNAEAKRNWATDIFNAIGLNQLSQALPRLKYIDFKKRDAATDVWLLHALLGEDQAPLQCREDDSGLWLRQCVTPAIPLELPLSEMTDQTFQMIKILRTNNWIKDDVSTDPGALSQFNDMCKSYTIRNSTIQRAVKKTPSMPNKVYTFAKAFGLPNCDGPEL